MPSFEFNAHSLDESDSGGDLLQFYYDAYGREEIGQELP
jgi:hypothetical protein